MSISVLDIFQIGIGPSSSHTLGPMRAARQVLEIMGKNLEKCGRLRIDLYGSLALTGKGHGTDKAILVGLLGKGISDLGPNDLNETYEKVTLNKKIKLLNKYEIQFDLNKDLKFNGRKVLPHHPNGMTFEFFNGEKSLLKKTYFSIGGGTIFSQEELESTNPDKGIEVPIPFSTADELLNQCGQTGLSISSIMLKNEVAWRDESLTYKALQNIWLAMQESIDRGKKTEGLLPGFLKVKRRAPDMYRKLKAQARSSSDPLDYLDWVNLYALAVNEENAAGGKVVTAPTNGAAGIIPAVLSFFLKHNPDEPEETINRFLLTAGAIAILYKKNSSISGAEVGCQGEVGVACSMAAGALTEIMGGTPQQVENAAEIGMEHNLGLTCDPIGGFVQVPCIERNAMGAVKAINAARLALRGDGAHKVSLDKVILTMKQTGADMKKQYKETSRGGLAVNIIEC